MTGLKLRISGVRSNCTTTTAPVKSYDSTSVLSIKVKIVKNILLDETLNYTSRLIEHN